MFEMLKNENLPQIFVGDAVGAHTLCWRLSLGAPLVPGGALPYKNRSGASANARGSAARFTHAHEYNVTIRVALFYVFFGTDKSREGQAYKKQEELTSYICEDVPEC